MRKIILVGTAHSYQCLGYGADEYVGQFRGLLCPICKVHGVRAVAEEYCEANVTRVGASESVAQSVCCEMGLSHQFSDASEEVRKQLGIIGVQEIRLIGFHKNWTVDTIKAAIREDNAKREGYWLKRLLELNIWPAIFICGADHCDSFAELLRESGIQVTVAVADWKPINS